jgi:DNA-binding transcriptional regulator YdaS (Cro superfamily)
VTPELVLVRSSVKRLGSTETARRLGLREGTVRAWVKGTSAPRAKACEAIRAALGIIPPKPARESPAATTSRRKSKGNGRTILPTISLSRPTDEGAKGEVTDHDDPQANAIATLKRLRALLEEVEPTDAPPIANAITASSRLLAKLTGQIDVSETMLLRSLGWARIKSALIESVRPYPEALKAMADAIETLSETA